MIKNGDGWKFFSAVALVLSMPGAASAATSQGTATAEIIDDISVTESEVLDFGTILSPSEAGTVVVSGSGDSISRDCGTLTCIGETYSTGQFQFTYSTLSSYSFSVPEEDVTITNGTDVMTISNFTDHGVFNALDIFNNTENVTRGVGGTLNVAAGQAAGEYTGTYTVTVSYQ